MRPLGTSFASGTATAAVPLRAAGVERVKGRMTGEPSTWESDAHAPERHVKLSTPIARRWFRTALFAFTRMENHDEAKSQ